MSSTPTSLPPHVQVSLPQPVQVRATNTTSRLFSRLGWLGFFLCGMLVLIQWSAMATYFDNTGGITEQYHSRDKSSNEKVAIIDISGVIMEGEGYVKKQIERIEEDDSVKAVVIRVNSPGGTVTGSDYIYHYLRKFREERPHIPVVVSMGSLAASGGYYVAMAVGHQEKAVFAEPTCTTGSIGVIIPHYDISRLMERFDIRDDSISSHPRKQMLSITRAMSDEERQLVQGYVNESYERFLEIVRSGRKQFDENPDALRQLATGEIFSATQAKKNGLIDEIGFLDDAIDRVCELAGINAKEVRVVHFPRPQSLLSLSGFARSPQPDNHLAMLLDLSTPRAYYLASSWPTLMTSRRAD